MQNAISDLRVEQQQNTNDASKMCIHIHGYAIGIYIFIATPELLKTQVRNFNAETESVLVQNRPDWSL